MRQIYEYSVKDVDDNNGANHGQSLDFFRDKMNSLVNQMETGQITNIHVTFAAFNEETKTMQAGNILAGVNQLGPWSQEESVTMLSSQEENLVQAYHTLVSQFALDMVDEGSRWSINSYAARSWMPPSQIHFKEE